MNVKGTSSVGKAGLNDPLVCCHLLAEDDGSAVLHIKLKQPLDFWSQRSFILAEQYSLLPPIMDKLWFTLFPPRDRLEGIFMAIGFV